MNRLFVAVLLMIAVAHGIQAADIVITTQAKAEPVRQQVYELRTYTVLPGRMPAMLKRFKDHTVRLFEKHGMQNIGYFTPQGKESETKLIYLLAHDSREAAAKSWSAFQNDPDWKKVRDASELDGKIVEKVDSVYMSPTDFSKLK